jgi:uncharacterized protein
MDADHPMEEHAMSDTTPRPDDQPAEPTDPTAPATPPPPAAATEPAPQPVPPAAQPTAPAAQPFDPIYTQPVGQPPFSPGFGYTQQQYAPPQPGQQPPPYGAAPGQALAPAPMSPTEERTWGMASHGIALAVTVISGGLLGFVAALITYLIVRDRGPFVRHHSANALNIQIIAGIVMLISIPLMFVLIGFVTFAAAWIFAVVVHIIGAVKANNGEWYTPPLTPQFAK